MVAPGNIKFNYQHPDFRLNNPLLHQSFIARVMAQEGQDFSRLDYIFCTDDYLLVLNQQHLGHDTYTDIITFTMSLPSQPLMAEIYISVDRVRDNASDLNTEFDEELLRVMVHGVLHLCGYDDSTPEEQKAMRKRENHYISLFDE